MKASAGSEIDFESCSVFKEVFGVKYGQATHPIWVVVNKKIDIARRPRLAAGGGAE